MKTVGIHEPPGQLHIHEMEYVEAYEAWKVTLPHAGHEVWHMKALAHAACREQHVAAQKGRVRFPVLIHKRIWRGLKKFIGVYIIVLYFYGTAHAQFSRINTINFQQGGSDVSGGFFAFPFQVNCATNLTCTASGNTLTMSAAGGAGTGCIPPGTVTNSLLIDLGGGLCGDVVKITWNNGTSTLLAISGLIFDFTPATTFKFKVGAGSTLTANGTAGQPLLSNADGTFTPGDPIVSGPDAVGAAPTKNPVQTGCLFLTTPATLTNNQVGAFQCDSGQRHIVTGAGGTFPVTGTFWQATQPVSGTVAVTQSTSPWIVAGGGTAGTAATGVVTVQGIAGMTKVLVTPDSVALPANQSVNVAQVNGVTTLTGAGATGTGSQRGTVAQDTTTIAGSAPGTAGTASAQVVTVQGIAGMTKILVTPDSVALPANQSVNVAQVNGITTSTGTGAVGTGTIRVAVGTDTATVAGTAPVANNATAIGTTYVPAAIGISQSGAAGGTAYTTGRYVAPDVFTDGALHVAMVGALRPASFHSSASFAGSSTTFASHLIGHATNMVLVTKIMFTCTQTTAGTVTVTVNKTSAASTGGTAGNMTEVPDDSTYSAASASAESFTGTGPTVGTLVGQIDAQKIGCNATATAGPNDIYVLDLRQKPIVLRATTQTLEIGVGAATTGGNYTVTYEWMEQPIITE